MRALIVALVLACTVVGAALGLEDADGPPIRGVIEKQLEAFGRDDAAGAYSYASPAIRELFPSEDRFMQMVREGYKPVYRPKSFTFETLKDTSAGPVQAVRIRDADGVDWIALYTLERQPDGSWKINGCQLVRAPDEAV